MAANDFLPFGTGSGANVSAQADYAALAARTSGFASGVAQSAQLNKTWRQASVMASALGSLIASLTNVDALDNGDIAGLAAKLQAMFGASAPGRLLRISVYSIVAGVQKLSINDAAFTTVGATTFTSVASPSGVVRTEFELIGAGGGAAGTPGLGTGTPQAAVAGGAGAGGICRGIYTNVFTTAAVVIGTPGAGGAPASAGTSGGNSTFSGATAGGGNPSSVPAGTGASVASPGGGGGTASGGNRSIPDVGGPDGLFGIFTPGGSLISGQGGSNFPYGKGGGGVGGGSGQGSNGNNASGFGAGGSGATSNSNGSFTSPGFAGGNGAPGALIIREYVG